MTESCVYGTVENVADYILMNEANVVTTRKPIFHTSPVNAYDVHLFTHVYFMLTLCVDDFIP